MSNILNNREEFSDVAPDKSQELPGSEMPSPPPAPSEVPKLPDEAPPEVPKPPDVAPADVPVVHKAVSAGIEVVALHKGFFDSYRKKEGDKFLVRSEKQLGSWMECVDPELQKKHLARISAKKKERRSAGK